MELTIDERILKAYEIPEEDIKIQQIGSGHINRTYLISYPKNDEHFIAQSINTHVFKQPEVIASNIKHVATYLKEKYPEYLFPAPVVNRKNGAMVHIDEDYWRLIPYINDSVALDTLSDPKQAYEAAKQFGKLSRLLDQFDSTKLSPTIIGFHDLALRYDQFAKALEQADNRYTSNAKNEIALAKDHQHILETYLAVELKADFPTRVMHHDTKISNVLLHKDSFEGLCVIDLDTLMPGKFISDLGDMMRTYLCAYSENETDLSKITIRQAYFEAMIAGYLSEMGDILTSTEKELILFSGKYIIYMQALRFLTDYLNGSIYYPTHYPEQNLDRAKNQFKLLQELIKNETVLQEIVDANLAKKQV